MIIEMLGRTLIWIKSAPEIAIGVENGIVSAAEPVRRNHSIRRRKKAW
jgi:hypothetical protein